MHAHVLLYQTKLLLVQAPPQFLLLLVWYCINYSLMRCHSEMLNQISEQLRFQGGLARTLLGLNPFVEHYSDCLWYHVVYYLGKQSHMCVIIQCVLHVYKTH